MANKYYRYYNPNPTKKEVGDCVERAICVVLDCDWLTAFDKLVTVGREICCPPNWKDCYEELLRREGFVYHGISNKKGTKRPTVEGFTKTHKTGVYFLRVANHVVGCKDGVYYDIWESGDSSMYGYWCKEGQD